MTGSNQHLHPFQLFNNICCIKMKIPSLLFVLMSLFCLSHSQLSTPPYWQTLGSVIPIDECDSCANQNFTLPPVIHQKTNVTTKNYWNLTNIKGTTSGSSKNVTVTSQNNTIAINNYLLLTNLTIDVTKKSGNKQTYNGTADVTAQIWISYSKQVVITQNQISFKLGSINYTLNSTEIGYSTVPPSADKAEFDTLIKNDVLNELKDYISKIVSPSVKQSVENYKIKQTSFNSTYNYKFDDFSILYLMNLESFDITNKTGLALAYNGSINGSTPTFARTNKPYDDLNNQASFFSKEFCQDFLKYSTKNNPVWKQILVDSTYKTDIFQFEMKDLVTIIPDAVKAYPGLFAKVYAKCNVVSQDDDHIDFDIAHGLINSRLGWNCTLFRTGGYGLLAFSVEVEYASILSQASSVLIHNISSASVKTSKLSEIQFKIQNPALASSYIASVLSSFRLSSTIGTNFSQPPRSSPKVVYTDNYIKISDLKTEVLNEDKVELQM